MDFPVKLTLETSKGEFPKSNPAGARPPTSPIQICAKPLSLSANASSTVPTMVICEAPLANPTAAVVKARKTSMIATAPVAWAAPSKRLPIQISIKLYSHSTAQMQGHDRLRALWKPQSGNRNPAEPSDIRGFLHLDPACRGVCHRARVRATRWLENALVPARYKKSDRQSAENRIMLKAIGSALRSASANGSGGVTRPQIFFKADHR
jgi:hypothetical protein